MKIFDKLVRDKIPEIVVSHYKKIPDIYIADDKEYYQRLKNKLLEEVAEFLKDDNLEELADVTEVIHAICKSKGHTLDDLETCRKEKAEKRGGFDKKIILKSVE